MFLFPISCILNSFLCSSYCDHTICNATWSIPPALLSYFIADWAPWPATEPSTVISFIGLPSALLSNELRKILNILSWFHFNRLFFLNWDGQEAVAPELPFQYWGWAADFKSKVGVVPPPLPFLPFPLTFWSSEGSIHRQQKWFLTWPAEGSQREQQINSNGLQVVNWVLLICSHALPPRDNFYKYNVVIIQMFPLESRLSPLYQWQVLLSK